MAQLDLLTPVMIPPMSLPSASAPSASLPEKASDAYKTISEVADEIDVPQHVLRFWESHFPQVKPSRMRGSRRYYRPEDIALLKTIKTLLYNKGYTIKGAKQVVRGKEIIPDMIPQAVPAVAVPVIAVTPPAVLPVAAAPVTAKPAEPAQKNVNVSALVRELRDLKSMLESVL
jgi:DNA-binding transcriptional MerR regulator